MRNRQHRFILLFFFLLTSIALVSCATLPAPGVPHNKVMSWKTRRRQLSHIKTWHIQGALAIHTTQKATSANINWQQYDKHRYQIYLFGPLGMEGAVISGTSSQVVLKNAKGEVFKANSPENLVQQVLGWKLPVSNLYYWVRGLPNPKLTSHKKFDLYRHLTELQQDGWDIQYLKYTGVGTHDLPSKIILHQGNLSLNIVIRSWKIS